MKLETPHSSAFTRRTMLGLGVAAGSTLLLAGCGAPGSVGDASSGGSTAAKQIQPKKPTTPVAITVLDGAGDLPSTQTSFQAYAKAHPELISSISFQTAAATDVAGKVKAQQLGNAVSISLVLGGEGVLGNFQSQNLALRQLPDYQSLLPQLSTFQDASMAKFQGIAKGIGLMDRYNLPGPLLAYFPNKITDPPRTTSALLAWAKAHPGKFSYASPPASGPGYGFLQSVPYLLGDKNPADPTNGWTKTWDYLAELGKYITSYPASSAIGSQQLGSGELLLEPTIVSIDIGNRKTGVWPTNSEVTTFKNQEWIPDGHFMMIPKGVSPEVLYVALQLEKYIVGEKAQAATYDNLVLTTANKNVTISQASATAQQQLKQWGRLDYYTSIVKTGKVQPPLDPVALTTAFTMWQEKIGANVGQ